MNVNLKYKNKITYITLKIINIFFLLLINITNPGITRFYILTSVCKCTKGKGVARVGSWHKLCTLLCERVCFTHLNTHVECIYIFEVQSFICMVYIDKQNCFHQNQKLCQGTAVQGMKVYNNNSKGYKTRTLNTLQAVITW